MSPTIQLFLGCFLLSLAISYAWWSIMRVRLLQIDLSEIRDAFRAEMGDRGWDDDGRCREFVGALDRLIRGAGSLSPAVIAPIARLTDGELRGLLGPEAEPFFRLVLDPGPSPPELLRAILMVNFRLARYLVFETFSGWTSMVKAMIFGIDDLDKSPSVGAVESRDSMEFRAFAILLSRGHYRRTA